MKIAFLGTGLMGEPLAARLLGRAYDVAVYNRSIDKTRALRGQGATVHDTPAGAVAAGEWIITMLADAAAIRETVLTPQVLPLLEGRRVLNMGTISPAQARDFSARVAHAGGQFMECPVLGSIPEARHGTLILMFGGTAPQFKQALPMLQTFGPMPLHIGEVGQASTVKLAMNQLIASLTTAFSMSLALVRTEGVDVDKFMSIVRESALYAPTYDKKLPRLLERHFDQPNFPLKHLLKDVDLFRHSAGAHGVNTDVLASLETLLKSAVEHGLADSDYAAVYDRIHPPVPDGSPPEPSGPD